jgi:hypothetical protein
MKLYLLLFIILSEIVSSSSFINLLGSFNNVRNIKMFQMKDINERKLYGTYLIGLRKTKRILKNSTVIYSLFNLTNDYVVYYTPNNNTIHNIHNIHTIHNIHNIHNTSNTNNIHNTSNTDVTVKNIIMGNIIIDVSNIKEIEIHTQNDKIILELDKREKDDTNMISMIGNINNIDTFINAANIFGYIMNIYKN